MELHEVPDAQRLLDQGREELALEGRERQRVLEQVQRESATVVGTLVDLAERRATVVVRVRTGATVTGAVDVVGDDVIRVGTTWVRTAAVVSVRADAGPATGDREPPTDLTMQAVLEHLAEDRERVVLLVDGGDAVTGDLVAAGADVLSVRLDGERAVAYVPVAAVAAVRPTS